MDVKTVYPPPPPTHKHSLKERYKWTAIWLKLTLYACYFSDSRDEAAPASTEKWRQTSVLSVGKIWLTFTINFTQKSTFCIAVYWKEKKGIPPVTLELLAHERLKKCKHNSALPLFLVGSSSNLQVTRTGIKSLNELISVGSIWTTCFKVAHPCLDRQNFFT